MLKRNLTSMLLFLLPAIARAATVTITIPSTSYINLSNVSSLSVGGSCSPANSPITVNMGGNGSTNAVCNSTGKWLVTNIDASGWNDGSIQFQALNSGASATKIFTKDTTPAYVDILAPVNGTVITPANMSSLLVSGYCDQGQILVTASSGSTTVQGLPVSCNLDDGSYRTNLNLSAIPDGTVYLSVSVTSPAGNIGMATSSYLKTSASTSVTLVSAQPAINIANAAALQFSGKCSTMGHPVYLDVLASSTKLTTLTTMCSSAQDWKITNLSVASSNFSDGTLTFQARHLNRSTSVWAPPVSLNLRKVTVPVFVTITSPSSGFKMNLGSSTSVAFSGTCSIAGVPVRLGYLSDLGELTVLASPICTANKTFSVAAVNFAAVADGVVLVSAQQSDSVGNMGRQDFSFSKKLTAPSLTLISNAAGNLVNIANAASVVLSGTCSEFGSLGQSVMVSAVPALSGQPLSAICLGDGTWTLPVSFTGLADGAIKISATLTDFAGNAVTKSLNLRKDTLAPTLAITVPAVASGKRFILNAANSATPITFSGTCNKNDSAISTRGIGVGIGEVAGSTTTKCVSGKWTLKVNFSAAQDGRSLAQRFTITDAARNSATQTMLFDKKVSLPTVTLVSNVVGGKINISSAASVLFSGTCSEFGTLGQPVLVTGTPALPGQPLTAICSDTGTWSLPISVTALADGALTVAATTTDYAGNSKKATLSLTKDTVAPTLAIKTPAVAPNAKFILNTLNSTTPITFTGDCNKNGATISASGLVSGNTTCSAGVWTLPLNFSSVADGRSLVEQFTIVDAAGNRATQSMSFDKKTTLPVITIASPASGSFINIANAATFAMSGACSEHGDLGQPVVVKIATSATGLATAPALSAVCNAGSWSHLGSMTALADGPVFVQALQSDYAGNSANEVRELVKKTKAPTLTLSAPLSTFIINSVNRSAVVFKGTCSENGRPISLTGALSSSTTCSSGAWTLNVNASSVPDGNVAFTFVEIDIAGNSAVQSISLLKDTLAPTLTIGLQGGGTRVPGNTFILTGSCSESGRSVVVTGSSSATSGTANCASGNWSLQLNSSNFSEGASFLESAVLNDAAGNNSLQQTLTLTKLSIPPPPPGILNMVRSKNPAQQIISAGANHTCVINPAGQVQCWGYNWGTNNILGNVSTQVSANPVTVNGIENAVSISSGYQHSCAVLSTGQIQCWGNWWSSDKPSSDSAPRVVYGIVNAVSVATSLVNTCATLSSGEIQCWGDNSYGGIGNGLIEKDVIRGPTKVLGITNAISVSGRQQSMCALLNSGRIKCWGHEFGGVPVEVAGITDAVAITIGVNHSCARLSTGDVKCWGRRSEVGDPNYFFGSDAQTPALIPDITNVVSVSSGRTHTCAVIDTGEIKCWGSNDYGQLGNMTRNLSRVASPPSVVPGITNAVAVTAGHYHTCATLDNGQITCWGHNGSLELGNNTAPTHSLVPVKVSSTTDAGNSLSVSLDGACVVLNTGRIQCWGNNSNGQLGNNSTVDSTSPVTVIGITDAVTIAKSHVHACALLRSGNIKCWGNNYYGQLGNNSTVDSATPVTVQGIVDAVSVSVSNTGSHSCAVLQSGEAKCWGANHYKYLGNNAPSAGSLIPITVSDVNNAVVVASGAMHSCVLLRTGEVQCWGHWSQSYPNGSLAMKIGITDAVSLSTTSANMGIRSCAVLKTGQITCWGYGLNPTLVPGITNAISVSTDNESGCAVLSTNEVQCWGNNEFGQLGNNSMSPPFQSAPTTIQGHFAKAVSVNFRSNFMIDTNGEVYGWGLIERVRTRPATLVGIVADVPKTQPRATNGHIEGMKSIGTSYVVEGWACAVGSPSSIQVQAFLGGPSETGTQLGVTTANKTSEPQIATLCKSTGSAYRYSVPISQTQRTNFAGKPIFIYGLSPYGLIDHQLTQSGIAKVF